MQTNKITVQLVDEMLLVRVIRTVVKNLLEGGAYVGGNNNTTHDNKSFNNPNLKDS